MNAVTEELKERQFQTDFFTLLSVKAVGENFGYKSEESLKETMGSYETINFDCLKTSIDTYESTCSKLGEFGLSYVRVFVNLCNSQFGEKLPEIIPRICDIAKKIAA